MGIETPPPHFASFGSIALMMGLFFGVGWGLVMWFLVWRADEVPIAIVICPWSPACSSVPSRQLALPSWQDYPTPK
jgi:uncharacterized protein DUF6404